MGLKHRGRDGKKGGLVFMIKRKLLKEPSQRPPLFSTVVSSTSLDHQDTGTASRSTVKANERDRRDKNEPFHYTT